ncbi:MAG TPA: hypothetical protein VMS17_26030 [Gemmataceae bacterium]|nr:hypothetical protein [Gemmataceae bacterium]
MSKRFEYSVVRIKDLAVRATVDKIGERHVHEVVVNDEPVKPTKRFWNSLHLRFGFTGNIFRYFSHDEVFNRISAVAPNDRIRCCLERDDDGDARLLGVTNPSAALMPFDDLMGLLDRYDAADVKYADGVVSSRHAPRCDGVFQVAGDGFQNKYILSTPIDGFGRPSVHLSLLRLVCSNGAVGYSPTFRSELSVGKGDDGVAFALTRVLDGFNNEDGYAALRQRFEAAAKSWASVNEVGRLYRTLTRVHNAGAPSPYPLTHPGGEGRVRGPARGGDGAEETAGSPLFAAFHRLTGDLQRIYGMANLNALSVKRQRTLPAACKVYDLLNFSSEVATHHADAIGGRMMQACIGDLISGEYDLENTVDQFSDWRDFFVGSGTTAETLADMNRRSR